MAFKFTEEQLNTLDKSFIVNLFLQLQDQNDKLSGEVQELNKKMEVLIEQITLANKNRFGRSSEKTMDTSQICFMEVDGTIVFFNEAEAISDLDAEEPDTLENKPARKPKTVGKKEADIKDLPVNIINHYLTDEELVAEFGENGWKFGIAYYCSGNHEWKVCKCSSALSLGTRILSLWSCHYTSKHGKLDDSIRRKLPGCVV